MVTQTAPSTVVTNTDRERLFALATSRSGCFTEVADNLACELERARIVEAEMVPAKVVTMNSQVVVSIGETLERQTTCHRAWNT